LLVATLLEFPARTFAELHEFLKWHAAFEVVEELVFRDAERAREAQAYAPRARHVATAFDVADFDAAEDPAVLIDGARRNLLLSELECLAKKPKAGT
jgi:hypothetical protein